MSLRSRLQDNMDRAEARNKSEKAKHPSHPDHDKLHGNRADGDRRLATESELRQYLQQLYHEGLDTQEEKERRRRQKKR